MKTTTNAERLNELFAADARTDTAIAKELNVSKQTISAWRNGTRSPKKSMLIKIAEKYHVRIEWLMGFDVERDPDSRNLSIPNWETFNKILLAMTPTDYEIVMDIIEKTQSRMRFMGKDEE